MSSDDERPSLAALYLRNREAMLRAARAILRNQHDAEDAVSVAIVKVAARLAAGHVPGEPDAYLVQAVRHAALDHLRTSARRRGQRPDATPVIALRPSFVDATQPPVDVIVTPDIADVIIDRQRTTEIRETVQRAAGQLAHRERTMLAMLLAGHTRADIGATFNLTGQRVGQLLKKPIADMLAELDISPSVRQPQKATGERR